MNKMKIKEYIEDKVIIKDAYIDGTLMWGRDENPKTMEIRYMTYKYKNYRYYMNHVHQEDYYE